MTLKRFLKQILSKKDVVACLHIGPRPVRGFLPGFKIIKNCNKL